MENTDIENKEKKHKGRGGARPGAGHPMLGDEPRTCTVSISGTKTEIQHLRDLAHAAGKTVSRYVLDDLE
ncbi:MAG: hypothetical protein MJ188_01735 [Treponema sp.]|nr:hypothetical protein [Treponema sp.]